MCEVRDADTCEHLRELVVRESLRAPWSGTAVLSVLHRVLRTTLDGMKTRSQATQHTHSLGFCAARLGGDVDAPILLAVLVLTFVLCTVGPMLFTFTVLFIIDPIPFVLGPISVRVLTSPRRHAWRP